MRVFQIVIDTNVVVSALRSKRGASHKLLTLLGPRKFEVNVSVPLILEYEKGAKRSLCEIGLSGKDIDDILDYVCAAARHRKIFYLWRPYLRDPKDDMVLELAVSAGCDFIVTYNKKDFEGSNRFGIKIITPQEFLKRIGALS